MREVSLALRSAYVTALRASLTFPVYGKLVPNDTSFPYIYFPTQITNNDSAKDMFSTDHTINVEVVHKTPNTDRTYEVEQICNQIKQIIAPLTHDDMLPLGDGLFLVDTNFENDTELLQYTDTHTIYRKILTFSNIIDEVE